VLQSQSIGAFTLLKMHADTACTRAQSRRYWYIYSLLLYTAQNYPLLQETATSTGCPLSPRNTTAWCTYLYTHMLLTLEHGYLDYVKFMLLSFTTFRHVLCLADA
jgi:hypothetical protein